MIVETGTVVAFESDSIWVETIQKTACEACVAQKGCGTRVLSKLTGKTNRIRVLLQQCSADDLTIGQDVTIAIPEDVIVKGSMLHASLAFFAYASNPPCNAALLSVLTFCRWRVIRA